MRRSLNIPIFSTVICTLSLTLLQAQGNVPAALNSDDVSRYADTAAATPLTSEAAGMRAAAMRYIANDHTTHVLLCVPLFTELSESRAANAGDIARQYMISAASFLYQHPDGAADSNAQNTAGLSAAVAVYRKFVDYNPRARSKFLDTVAKRQKAGELSQFVAETCPQPAAPQP